MILADTSVWVDHLRRHDPHLSALLEAGEIVTHPFVIGELACGTISDRRKVLSLMKLLPEALKAQDDEVMLLIERRRLMGTELGFIDMHLLAASLISGFALWTHDRRLASVALEIGTGYTQE